MKSRFGPHWFRHGLFLAFALLAAARAGAATEPAAITLKERAQGYRDHVILAKPLARERAGIEAHEARAGVRVREKFARFGDLRVIVLDSTEAADRAIARLRASGRYEFVEHDRLSRPAVVPNDNAFSQQWALNNTGQSGGTAGADIKATAAWDIQRDASGVVVAVLDSGVNINHLDLIGNIWRNPAPTFGDINGACFLNGERSGDVTDGNGHGTHCAGIIGAVGNNNAGISGVAWRVQLMPLRIMSSEGLIATSDFAAGVDYAISHGAQILSVSLFSDTHSQADLAIVQAARDAGVILAVAAGNESENLDASPRYYPDSYPLDNIVSVGASTRNETLASFSNYGAFVDLVAPGQSILSLYFGDNTGGVTLSGTSMAAPHVAGALALLKARFPNDTYRQLINRLLRGVDVLPAYAGKAQTGGRLNLLRALTGTDNRPFNDDFADRARVVGPNLGIRSNNAGARSESGEPAHAGVAAASTLWWQWTAPAPGTVSVDTAGSAYDTVLAVYTGSNLTGLTAVASNDDDGANRTSRLTFTAQAGTAYQLAVGSKDGATGATFLSLGTPPANDTFAGAITLSGVSTQIKGSNLLATRETGEPRILDLPGGASVWYRWTAPRTGRFQVSIATINYFDPLLAVYTGSALNALTRVAASDNIGPGAENVDALCTVDATAGTIYYIAVDTKVQPNTGEFTLTITDALWQAATLRSIGSAPAVAPDGTIYAGSSDFNLYAFAPDGSVRWRFPTQDSLEHSTPAIAPDGTLYLHSLDSRLYALRPDGTLRWQRDFGARPSLVTTLESSSPALGADGTVYQKSGDGYIHALDPANGATRWRYNIGATASYASPAIGVDGTIYLGSGDQYFYALTPAGALRWRFTAGEPINSAPALDASGNVYLTLGTTARLLCLSPEGTLRWSYAGATGGTASSPALSADGGTVYFGARDQRLHAVNTTGGAARWTLTLGGEVLDSSPALDANGTIYLGAHDGKLYAINADGTLKRTWDAGGPIDSSPAISGTTLYVGSDDAKLYALDIGAGPAGGAWPQFHHHARRTSRARSDVPLIGLSPEAQTIVSGTPLTLRVVAGGGAPLAYQWSRNGAPITGATAATYSVASATEALAGSYTVTVTNAFGAANSTAVTVTIVPAGAVSSAGRLVNLSVLSELAAPADMLVVGTVVGGTGTTGAKPLLMRVAGPSLSAFNVAGPLVDPRLDLFTGRTQLNQNDNWSGDGQVRAITTQVAAFPFASADSRDAALYIPNLARGDYTVRATGMGGATGAVLVEIYDATPTAAFAADTPRLINVSVLKNIRAELTAGFVIGGSTSQRVLVRAIGPTLATSFNVTGTLADPRLELFDSAARSIGRNDDWGGSATLTTAFDQVGAFSLSPDSRDAALLITLPPGSYTARVGGPTGASGNVLVEVYEVP